MPIVWPTWIDGGCARNATASTKFLPSHRKKRVPSWFACAPEYLLATVGGNADWERRAMRERLRTAFLSSAAEGRQATSALVLLAHDRLKGRNAALNNSPSAIQVAAE